MAADAAARLGEDNDDARPDDVDDADVAVSDEGEFDDREDERTSSNDADRGENDEIDEIDENEAIDDDTRVNADNEDVTGPVTRD